VTSHAWRGSGIVISYYQDDSYAYGSLLAESLCHVAKYLQARWQVPVQTACLRHNLLLQLDLRVEIFTRPSSAFGVTLPTYALDRRAARSLKNWPRLRASDPAVCERESAVHRRQMIYAAGLLLFAGMIAGIIHAMFVPRISVEQVRSAIDSGVPVGTSEADVRAWLGSQSYLLYSGGIADKKTGRFIGIGAYIPNSGPRWETPEQIDIHFVFTNGKLSHVEVKRRRAPSL
jgi:hypothetical protein